jgi:hypothetical protein
VEYGGINMYSIAWCDNTYYQLIGNLESVLFIANKLENLKIKFQVADTRGFVVNQNQAGCGGFLYWKE